MWLVIKGIFILLTFVLITWRIWKAMWEGKTHACPLKWLPTHKLIPTSGHHLRFMSVKSPSLPYTIPDVLSLTWWSTSACMNTKWLQSCLTLWDPMDCSPPGSSVHGILQARILEWAAISFSKGFPNPGIEPVSLISPASAGRFFCLFCFLTLVPTGKPRSTYICRLFWFFQEFLGIWNRAKMVKDLLPKPCIFLHPYSLSPWIRPPPEAVPLEKWAEWTSHAPG